MDSALLPLPAFNVPFANKSLHVPAPQSSPLPVPSEYSDPDNATDDDPFSEIFCPEYQSLIFFNAERGENRFKTAPVRVRPVKHSHRSKVIAWLYRISDEMLFLDETLLLGASLFDRVTALKRIDRRVLQLHACTCLWIASKIEEKLTPTLSDFMYLCGGIYTTSDFIDCENLILNLLHFAVASTTAIVYVQGAVECVGPVPELARFFCLVLMVRSGYGGMNASVMGTTAVVLASLICGGQARLVKQPVDAILGCTQQVILALQEIGATPENPMRRALPRWLAGKGISSLRERIAAIAKTDAIQSFCSSQ
jgi:hypothetical protein